MTEAQRQIIQRLDQILAASGGGGAAWGGITGTLSEQTDLQSALDLKQTVAQVNALIDAALAAHGVIGSVTFTDTGTGGEGDPVFVILNQTGIITDISGTAGTVSIGITAQPNAFYGVATDALPVAGAAGLPIGVAKTTFDVTLSYTGGAAGKITVCILKP